MIVCNFVLFVYLIYLYLSVAWRKFFFEALWASNPFQVVSDASAEGEKGTPCPFCVEVESRKENLQREK